MSVFAIACPECKATLRSSKPVPTGKVVTCPKCSVMFPAPAAKPQPVAVPAGVGVVDDEFADVEIVEDPPKKKEPPKPVRRIIDEGGQRKRKKKTSTGFIIGLCAGLVLFAGFVTGAIFAVKWLLAENNDPVAYMPPKPMILGSIDVGKVLESPLGPAFEGFLNSGEFGKYCQDAGVTPKSAVDRMAFGVGQARPGVPGAVGFVLVSKAGFDKQKFAKAFNATSTVFGGRSVFQSGSGQAAQTMVFTSKLVATISGPPSEAEDVVRTAGRNSMPTLVADMVKRVSNGHAWFVMDPVALPQDIPAMRGLPGASRDALGNFRSMGVEGNLAGDILEIKVYMLTPDKAAAEKMVQEASKQSSSGGAFGLNPTEPPTVTSQDALVTAVAKFKTADLVGFANMASMFRSMIGGPPQPAGGGRGGRGGR